MRVALTRERGRNEELVAWLPEGAESVEVPLTETRYVDEADVERDLEAGAARRPFASLVVTSSRSARYVALALRHCTKDVEVFSVGAATTRSLRDLDVVPRAQSSAGSIELSRQIREAPVLLLGALAMREDLAKDLRSRGLEVTSVACYETRPLELDEGDRETLARCDVVVIGAPSAWNVARSHVSSRAWVVVPGTSTQRSVEADHARVVVGWGASWRQLLVGLELADGEDSGPEQ